MGKEALAGCVRGGGGGGRVPFLELRVENCESADGMWEGVQLMSKGKHILQIRRFPA